MNNIHCVIMVKYINSGSVSGYYKGKLIVTRPLTKNKTIETYRDRVEIFIREGLEKGYSIQSMIKFNIEFIKLVRYKNTIREPMPDDWDTILIAIMILIRFKQIEEDGVNEGLLIMNSSKRKETLGVSGNVNALVG